MRFPVGHYSYYGSWVNQWLNFVPRQDWVNNTQGTDKNVISFGCALAFLFYLNSQLNFSINQIIAAGASTLATVYRTLTGDTKDPFLQRFLALLELYFPSAQQSNLTNDNPFPLLEEQQHVFYRGTDGIHHVFWHPPTNQLFRDQWTGSDASAAVGGPATLVWPDQQHIFYRGTDGTINHIFWDAASNQLFSDQWTLITGAPVAAGDPATMVTPNQQHIFWDAATNRLFSDQWTPQPPGAFAAAGDPATMVWPNQQHIFYRGTDGAINHIFWDAATNRLFNDQWTEITGAPPAAGDPATMMTRESTARFLSRHGRCHQPHLLGRSEQSALRRSVDPPTTRQPRRYRRPGDDGMAFGRRQLINDCCQRRRASHFSETLRIFFLCRE